MILFVFAMPAFAAGPCDPIVCVNGDVYRTCDESQKRILYAEDPCPKAVPPFTDLLSDDPYVQSITALRQEGILKGYPDGTFRSARPVSRVELLKVLLEVLGRYRPTQDRKASVYQVKDLGFSDAIAGEWYVPYLRRAVDQGWIEGYPDGTVRPADPVSFVEAAKLITLAYDLELERSSPWYKNAIEALSERFAIPPTVAYLESSLKRGEMAELLWRLREGLTDRPAKSSSVLLALHCEPLPQGQQVAGVDQKRVIDAWLLWLNGERARLALPPYATSVHLGRTAYRWSFTAATRGYITHLRDDPPGTDGILAWFAEQGVTFGNAYGSRYAENIAYGPMECHKEECTREMIGMIRAVFDAFMLERGTGNDAHYRSIVHPDFRQMGIGLAVDAEKRNYYLTVHYAADARSTDPPLCD